MTAAAPSERLAGLLAATDVQRRLVIGGRPIALGWATVELERAAVELGTDLGTEPGRFLDAPGTRALGARCRVAHGVLPGDLALVLLEPATEGRLAATLARFAEGPAAFWLSVNDLGSMADEQQAGGVWLSVERAGPFGPERLVLDGPVHGPHQLLVERAGTIRM
jgi:hypothetical protein